MTTETINLIYQAILNAIGLGILFGFIIGLMVYFLSLFKE